MLHTTGMRVRLVAVAVVAVATVLACRHRDASWPLAPVGANALDEKQSQYADDGAGWLARASVHLWLGGDDGDDAPDGSDARGSTTSIALGGEAYGGNPFAGDPFGGQNYAGWQPQSWDASKLDTFAPSYETSDGLTGAIEGTIAWTGATPARLTSSCGAIEPSPRIGPRGVMRGVVVYIDKIETGRETPTASRPMVVGGTIAKHGCGFEPVAQIVAPTSTTSAAPLAIYGDDRPATLRITPPNGVASTVALQAGAITAVTVPPGVTRVADEAGTSGAAWVVGLDTPYYSITDDTGHFRIDQLPEGPFVVTVWVPPSARVGANGSVTYGDPIVVTRNVNVVAAKIAAMNVAVGRR